jgi:hypothetical protein
MTTIVDSLYQNFKDLVIILDKGTELSLRNTAEDTFRKALLLSAASYFEEKLVSDLIQFFDETSSKNRLTTEFLKNKAINRQYHSFFNWRDKNANQFFGLFGDAFIDFMKNEVRKNSELDESIRAFLQLGEDRNRLVHGNYGSFVLEKTTEEIFESYQKASYFIEIFPQKLRDFCR